MYADTLLRMYSTIFAAVSTDGHIADVDNQQKWVPANDAVFLGNMLKNYDVLVMGRKTFEHNTTKFTAPGKIRIVLTTKPKFYAKKYPTAEVVFVNQNLAGVLATYASKNVAILGGTQIYTEALLQGLCSDAYITNVPTILGSGIPFTNPANIMQKFYILQPKTGMPKQVKYFIKLA